MTNIISNSFLGNETVSNGVAVVPTELTKDQFLGKMLDILHDSKNGATADYLSNKILELVQQYPVPAKDLGLPDDHLRIKKEIVDSWKNFQANTSSQTGENAHFIGDLLSKKQLGKIVAEKVDLKGLPQVLKEQLKESVVESAITNGIRKDQHCEQVAAKIFNKLPRNLQTDENRESLEKYIQIKMNTIVSTSACDISQQGAEFIGSYEKPPPESIDKNGLYHIYDDKYGNPTIGYGHLLLSGEAEKFKKGLTYNEVLALKKNDLKKFVTIVRSQIKVPLTQKQFDALVSLAYNRGSVPSGMVDLINSGNFDTERLKKHFNSIIWATNQNTKLKEKSPGLINRRLDEIEMFFDGDYKRTH